MEAERRQLEIEKEKIALEARKREIEEEEERIKVRQKGRNLIQGEVNDSIHSALHHTTGIVEGPKSGARG